MNDTSTAHTAPVIPATATPAPTVGTLETPDARLYYEVRGQGPLVVLVGAPMDAAPFAGLADLLATDHTVLTTDPRGIHRSPLVDPDQDSTPQMRADDLSRLIAHLDAGPAVVLGSSGGAVSVLALVQAHPEQVHTVIAHEPPLLELLEDPAYHRAQIDDIIATHLSGDVGGAWVKFLAHANIVMPEPGDLAGDFIPTEPSPQEIADANYQNAHMLRPTTRWVPDVEALRRSTSRVLIGLGEDSGGQICERTSKALAAELGTEPTMFPGGHIGFAEDPARFVVRFREVLAQG
jgi:pimeloyl-ACP methyl ester carboxylesterase